MAGKKYYTIKNIVTGYTFDLTKEECDKLIIEEPYNFKVVDKDYKSAKAEKAETSTYEQVVIPESNEG